MKGKEKKTLRGQLDAIDTEIIGLKKQADAKESEIDKEEAKPIRDRQRQIQDRMKELKNEQTEDR